MQVSAHNTRQRRGAAGQQYAIIVGLIGVVAIFAISALGTGVKGLMQSTANALSSQGNSVTGGGDGSPPATDIAPDAFSYADQSNVATNTLITSNIVTPTGYNSSAPVTISGTGSPQFSINGGTYGTSGNISPGQTLTLRLTSGPSAGDSRSATVIVGGTSAVAWTVTTAVPICPPGSTALVDGRNGCIFDVAGTYTSGIPNSYSTATFKVWGAGARYAGNYGWGGGGGYATGRLTIGSGKTVQIYVGGIPGATTSFSYGTSSGGTGYTNGGSSGIGQFSGSGGGGSSAVVLTGTPLLVAGGGGGGGRQLTDDGSGRGGAGGGSSGQAGSDNPAASPPTTGGGAGTASSAGAGGTGTYPGTAGSGGTGGDGGGTSSNCVRSGGGGGGGYYGGGGGGASGGCGEASGGGGGSSFVDTGRLDSGTTNLLAGSYSTPGNSGDADRSTAATGASQSTSVAPGRIVMILQ